jgi:hypothetical protein
MTTKATGVIARGRRAAVKTFTRNKNNAVEERDIRQARALSNATNPSCVAWFKHAPFSTSTSVKQPWSRFSTSVKQPLALAFTLLLASLAFSSASVSAMGLQFGPGSSSLTSPALTPQAPAPEFGSEGEGAGQFSAPTGIAINTETGDVVLADTANNRVDEFTAEGGFVRTWGWGVRDGKPEFEVCVAPGPCRAGLRGGGAGQFGNGAASGVAIDNSGGAAKGDVYVVDRQNDRVDRFGPQGEFILSFGEAGAGPGQFEGLGLNAISVGSTGTVYVADIGRVQKFSPSGTLEGAISMPASVSPINRLLVDSAGDLYVPGFEGVHKFDGTGTELGSVRDPGASGASLALGPGDELIVSDPSQGHIFGYDPSGAPALSVELPDPAAAGGGLAVAGGVMYVVYGVAQQPQSVRLLAFPPPGPVILEGSEKAGGLSTTGATLEATVNPEGAATEYHFEYGTTAAYGQSTPVAALDGVNEVQSLTVTATGGSFTLGFQGESSGAIPFDGSAGEVQAALEAIPALGVGQVAVSGEAGGPFSIEFTGSRAGQDVPELSAEAAGLTGEEPTAIVATTTPAVSLFADRQVNAPLTGLAPGTTYHFRVVAENASGTVEGPDQTFETLPPVSIESESASAVTADSAKLSTELNAHGLRSEYHFEYGTTTAYGLSAPEPDAEAGEGSEPLPFSVTIQHLKADTTYHYRVVAHNSLGVSVGSDATFTTQGEEAATLPDGRAWEMVSPPQKHGGALKPIGKEGTTIQAAADGSGLAYMADAPVEEDPEGNRSLSPSTLLAKRGAPGVWSTQDITTPHQGVTGVIIGHLTEYELFSSDLELGAVEPIGRTPLAPRPSEPSEPDAEPTPYLREPDGTFTPLAWKGNVAAGAKIGGTEVEPEQFEEGVTFVTATPDFSHVLVESKNALVEGFDNEDSGSLYEWDGGTLTPVSVLPDGAPAENAAVGNENRSVRDAISTDGSRVFFSVGGVGLFMRDTKLGPTGRTLRIDTPEAGVNEPQFPDAVFQLASPDGSSVLFTDQARLTSDATAKEGAPDLYRCQVEVSGEELSCSLKDLSVDPHANEAAAVQGAVIGAGEDGRVYFVTTGALGGGEAAARRGVCPVAGEGACVNLYEVDTQEPAPQEHLVAVLSSRDGSDWAALEATNLGLMTSRVSPSGRFLAFMSDRSLTGYDNRDIHSGVRDQEVYEFDAETGRLSCASCDPTGQRPSGVFDSGEFPGLLVDAQLLWGGQTLAGSIPGWTPVGSPEALYQSRYLSDSGRLFFNSPVGLVPGDGNSKEDVYEYEPEGVGSCTVASACLGLISSGTSSEESAFLDASETGDDVFFLTAAQLSLKDTDTALDVYDAHVCSTAPGCAPPEAGTPPPCSTSDSCRTAPTPQPGIFSAPASQTFSGPGNPTPAPPKVVVKSLTRAQKLAKALKTCKKTKGNSKQAKAKRAKCEKAARKKFGPVKRAKKKGK